MVCPSLLNVFLKKSQLLLLKGDIGVGKTYAIQKACEEANKISSKKKIKLITYDAIDFKTNYTKFIANLYSRNLDNTRYVIVLDHVEHFDIERKKKPNGKKSKKLSSMEKLMQFVKSRNNTKRTIDFQFKPHASVIIECDLSYNFHINQLQIDNVLRFYPPSEMEKLAFLTSFFPINKSIEFFQNAIQNCDNYNDLLIRINELQHLNIIPEEQKKVIEIPKRQVKNLALQQFYQSKKTQFNNNNNNDANNNTIVTFQKNALDLNLFKNNIFHAIDCIRQQNKQSRGLSVNSFDKFLQFDQDDLAMKYHALLPVVYGFQAQSNNTLDDISNAIDTFCDLDIGIYFPSEMKSSFYQIALWQSPTYEEKKSNNCATTGNESLKLHDWGLRIDYEKLNTMKNIKHALNAITMSQMCFLETLWTSNQINNLLEWELFPPHFLQWDDEHRQKHNQNAIPFTFFTGKQEEPEQELKPINTKRKKLYNREEAANKRKLL